MGEEAEVERRELDRGNKEEVRELKVFLARVFRPLMDMKPMVSRYRPDARPQALLSYLA